MDAIAFMPLVLLAALAAGFLGALTGLGGGVVVIPALVLIFGIALRDAIGASLVAVIATSSGAAAAFLREGYTNLRVGVFLEIGTVLGALAGAALAPFLPVHAITLVFVLVLLWSAYASVSPKPLPKGASPPDALATRLGLHASYPGQGGATPYRVHHAGPALGVMFGAGVLSALVGVGSGVVKVAAMDRLMRLPFKVSTTTSNFMIGVTAAASAGVYLARGQVRPELAGPVALGALLGSLAGASVLPRMNTLWLRRIFALVVVLAGVELLRRTLLGGAL